MGAHDSLDLENEELSYVFFSVKKDSVGVIVEQKSILYLEQPPQRIGSLPPPAPLPGFV